MIELAEFKCVISLHAEDVPLLPSATSVLERALALARNRRTALWYEPRILAMLADAKLAAGDRSAARALLSEARELVDRGRGWRLGAFDVALAWIRLLASEPASDRTAIESALESPGRPHGRAGLRSLSAHRCAPARTPRHITLSSILSRAAPRSSSAWCILSRTK